MGARVTKNVSSEYGEHVCGKRFKLLKDIHRFLQAFYIKEMSSPSWETLRVSHEIIDAATCLDESKWKIENE